MRSLGRTLQVIGLILLPLGLIYGAEGGQHSMTLEFGLLVLGALVFALGWKLQREP